MAVSSRPIIKDLDVIEDIGPGELTRFVDALANPFFFQAAEERLRHRIIPAVSPPAHAGLQIIGQAEAPPVVATVLTALIRMNDDRVLWFPAPDSHRKRIQCQFPRQAQFH